VEDLKEIQEWNSGVWYSKLHSEDEKPVVPEIRVKEKMDIYSELRKYIISWSEGKKRIVILGTGAHTDHLFLQVPELNSVNIIGYIDNNSEKHGAIYRGCEIHPALWAKERADVVICSSFANEQKLAESIDDIFATADIILSHPGTIITNSFFTRVRGGYFADKKGLEIGGPSAIFLISGYIPVYDKMESLDNVNFSASTVWTGNVDAEKPFSIDGKDVGRLYIIDATDLTIIPDDEYDFILSSNNIEHIANPLKAIEQWLMKLKPDGVLMIVAPVREMCFDHKRNIVKFSHILDDYHKNVNEDDLSHIDEILSLHDLALDPAAGTLEQFTLRSYRNAENRCLHHHVFNADVLDSIRRYFNLKSIHQDMGAGNHIALWQK
jgi:hypothetical protein